jgi:hypothetical protein
MSRHSTTERIKISRRSVIAILALLILETGLAQEGIEREGYFEVRSASTQVVDGVHTLDARLQCHADDRNADAGDPRPAPAD